MQVNKADNHWDLLAKLGFLLGETFGTIAENEDIPDETAYFWFILADATAEAWDEGKPDYYSAYDEFAE